jgi:hypothetical protein
MTQSEKQSWEKVRASGRDRFLLGGIARRGWVFILAGAFVEIVWWLFTSKPPVPLVATIAKWALAAVGGSTFLTWREWDENESNYQKSNKDEAGH